MSKIDLRYNKKRSAIWFIIVCFFITPFYLLTGFLFFIKKKFINIFFKAKKLEATAYVKKFLQETIYSFLKSNNFSKREKFGSVHYERQDESYMYDVVFEFNKAGFPEFRMKIRKLGLRKSKNPSYFTGITIKPDGWLKNFTFDHSWFALPVLTDALMRERKMNAICVKLKDGLCEYFKENCLMVKDL